MPDYINTNLQKETTVLIGVITRDETEDRVKEYLEELAFLVDTAGAVTVKKFIQRLDVQNSKTYVGSGKLSEISTYVAENKIDIAIFDDELNPSQIRNIEKALKTL